LSIASEASSVGRLRRILVPTRVSDGFTLALGVVILLVLLVGGASLALALRIYRSVDAISEEYGHILSLDEVHSVFDDLIFDLQQMGATASYDPTAAEAMHSELVRRIEIVAALHASAPPAFGAEADRELLDELRREGEDLHSLARDIAGTSGPRRLDGAGLARLRRASHDVPRAVAGLVTLHRQRIATLLRESREMARDIVVIYVGFILVGGVLVTLAGIVSRHAVTAPLARLADAAGALMGGRLETRVRVQSASEIGELSHAFNAMADGLQCRQQELQGARDQLEQRVREVQTLYRIGTEVSRLHHADRVLQSVVEKARELLHCDAALLCLDGSRVGDLADRATSGPPEAFAFPAERERAGDPWAPAGPCGFIDPEYRRGHASAVLRVGEGRLGEIHVCTREERSFTPWEVELLDGLATQAAIAIEGARLADELRNLATVQERERLAREMHDGLAQALGTLLIKLHQAQAQAQSGDPRSLAANLREMIDVTGRAYEDVRQSIFGLRTFVARGLGLVPTLTEYLHEFSAQNGIAVDLEVAEDAPLRLPPGSEVQAIRIIQEALTNVRKHASARHASVRVRCEGDQVLVMIEDDGVGWSSGRSGAGGRLHFGLQSMRERAESLGGTLAIDSAPGRGTRVIARLRGEA